MLEPVAFESFLERRYGRASGKRNPLIFEIACDDALKHQYYLLREDLAVNLYGGRKLAATTDEYDARSHIIIARQGRQCLAGVRLTVKEPGGDEKLPCEATGFTLPDRQLRHLSSVRSAEVSHFFAGADDEQGTLVHGIAAEIINTLIFKKVRLAFFSLNPVLAKGIKILAKNNNFKWQGLPASQHGESLYLLDLAPAYKIKDDIKQYIKPSMLPA